MYSLGYRKQLDIFTPPLLDASFKASEYTPYYPTVSPDNAITPIEFQINETPHCYLDLFTSVLYVKAKVYEIANDGTKKKRYLKIRRQIRKRQYCLLLTISCTQCLI